MRYISILLISLFFFSCEDNSKTYEEIEAEVLCDVLPEILERELKFYSVRIPPPPQILDSLKYNDKQLDSIRIQDSLLWDKYLKEYKVYYKSQLSKIREYKKVQQKVLDTLLYVKKLFTDETIYLKSELDSRKVGLDEFNNSNINVNLVPYSNTFEG